MRCLTPASAIRGRSRYSAKLPPKLASPTAFVLELLVRLRPASGSKIQQRPHRLYCTDMPWILLGLGRHEQQFRGPAQPDDPVRSPVEHGEDRHLLPLLILAMIVPFEAVVGG